MGRTAESRRIVCEVGQSRAVIVKDARIDRLLRTLPEQPMEDSRADCHAASMRAVIAAQRRPDVWVQCGRRTIHVFTGTSVLPSLLGFLFCQSKICLQQRTMNVLCRR